jgi:hypothetical protein
MIDIDSRPILNLVGRTITAMFVNEDQSILVFATNTGDVSLSAMGDCCSESWFADLLGVDVILGQEIKSVEEVPLPNYDVNDGRGRQDEDHVYGFRFTTGRGYADLIFRNSSNGYYGGWLTAQETEGRPANLTAIVADWHA